MTEIFEYLIAAWLMKFWQMVMDPSSKLSFQVRTYDYHVNGCLMRTYMVIVCWICSAFLRMSVGEQAKSNRCANLVLIMGMTHPYIDRRTLVIWLKNMIYC